MPASTKRRIRDDTPRSIALSRQRSPVRRAVEVLPERVVEVLPERAVEVLPERVVDRSARRWPRALLTAAAVLAFLLLL